MPVTTFILVHGAGCSSAVWAPVARELALLGHRTVAVDLPGHGLGATGERHQRAGCVGRPPPREPGLDRRDPPRPAHHRSRPSRRPAVRAARRRHAEADAATPDNPFDVHSVTSSHIGFQIHPTEIIRTLDGLAEKR